MRSRALDQLRHAARRPAEAMPVLDMPETAARDDTEVLALDRLSTIDAIGLIGSLPREAVVLRTIVGVDAATAAWLPARAPVPSKWRHTGDYGASRKL